MLLVRLLIVSLLIVIGPWQAWCQSKTTAFNRLRLDRAVSQLNGSRWYARAFAVGESTWISPQKYEVSTWFDASFLTYRPHRDYTSPRVVKDSTTQSLYLKISHLPMTSGKFNLSDSTAYQHSQIRVRCDLLQGDSVVKDSYYLAPNSKSWIQIAKYDRKNEVMTGTFNLKLVNKSGEVIDFKKGIFKVRMVYELK